MKLKTLYDYFIVYVIIVKIIFVILAISLVYLKIKHHGEPESKTMQNISYWKDRTEFAFIANMSIMLGYLFYPKREKLLPIDNESKMLLFTYGIVILLTEKWGIFISESKWYPYLKRKIFGTKQMTPEEEEIANKQAQINKNIRKSETMRNIQDYPNVNRFHKNNAEYQKYYTLIYPQDTLGQYAYEPQNVANAATNFSKNFPTFSDI